MDLLQGLYVLFINPLFVACFVKLRLSNGDNTVSEEYTDTEGAVYSWVFRHQ